MRQTWADSLTGLCILYMVAMHVSLITETPIYGGQFLFFFMPWFFFKSGMFYKVRPIKQQFVKDAKRLLIPYVVFTVFGWLLYLPFEKEFIVLDDMMLMVKNIAALGGAFCNSPLWFLLVLFLIRQVHNLFQSISQHKRLFLWCELIVSFVMAMIMSLLNIDRPLWVPNVLLGLSYFAIGTMLKGNFDELSQKKIVIVISFMLYGLSFITLGNTNFEGNTADGGVLGYMLWCFFSIAGIILYSGIFRLFTWLNVKPLLLLGVSSMTFFVAHWPIAFAFNELLNNHFTGFYIYVLVLVIVLTACMILNWFLRQRKYSFLIGE